jgi:hypothetical protein
MMPGSRVRVPPLVLIHQPLGEDFSSGFSHLTTAVSVLCRVWSHHLNTAASVLLVTADLQTRAFFLLRWLRGRSRSFVGGSFPLGLRPTSKKVDAELLMRGPASLLRDWISPSGCEAFVGCHDTPGVPAAYWRKRNPLTPPRPSAARAVGIDARELHEFVAGS